MFADHTHGVNMVMRYESIESDLSEVFRKAGMGSKADIAMINRTDERANSDYRSFYSRVAELTVTLAYSGDLRMYGYRF